MGAWRAVFCHRVAPHPTRKSYDLRLQPKPCTRATHMERARQRRWWCSLGSLRLIVDGSQHDLHTGDSVFFHADLRTATRIARRARFRCLDVIRYPRRGE